jgi:hypothetical protein
MKTNSTKELIATSTFFSTAQVDTYSGYDTKSNGDLFPSCWADNDVLYTSNGDGWGFGDKSQHTDIVLSGVQGTPETGIVGELVSRGEAIANVWGGKNYNRKPTGMIAVDGDEDGKDELYLAVQDLNSQPCPHCADDAPNAGISKSVDYGKTWIKNDKPMFTNYKFTTIFFLDFGKSGENVKVLGKEAAKYVYAYGIDYNWRSSTDNSKPKPADLYLARVAKNKIQERGAWEFFSGMENDIPAWNADINKSVAVLHDARKVYPELSCGGRPLKAEATDVGVISQGGVVYNKPLNRYIYTSWTWYTFEFYEAPTPWGPWKLFLSKDFGAAPFYGERDTNDYESLNEGGYPTTIPSKFISSDGKTMWVQSNSWKRWNYAGGSFNYNFSLRKLRVEPFKNTRETNKKDASVNIAAKGEDVTPIEKTAVHGRVDYYNDGIINKFETSYDCDKKKSEDYWGFIFSTNYNFNQVAYTSGETTNTGGWFEQGLIVQVRQNFQWKNVESIQITPSYPYNQSAGSKTYQISFTDITGDGIRIIGKPGGSQRYTSIAELEVYYK